MQPKRKKGAAAEEAENDEEESTLIHEELPAAAPSAGFYFDEGDDYAQYETMAAEATVAPAPVQITEDVKLRIEANKRAAEARRAAKAAAAAAELAATTAEGQEESTVMAPNQMQQQEHLVQQVRVDPGSASEDMFHHELHSEPQLDDEKEEEVSDGTLLGVAQQPSASLIRSGDEEAAGSAEVELVVEVNGQAEGKQQEGEERSTVCEERGEEESSVFTKPLRSIVIGCSDSVFASLTKRNVSCCCCCCCYYYYCSC
jgi:hypothetical protein